MGHLLDLSAGGSRGLAESQCDWLSQDPVRGVVKGMKVFRGPATTWGIIFMALTSFSASDLLGQGVAEHAVTTAKMGGAAAQVKPNVQTTRRGSASETAPSLHLPIRQGEPIEVRTRRALEERAGEKAGQILIRSIPTEVHVWINGEPVGRTPLLLSLAPGSYVIEMRGDRLESGRSQIDVLPLEQREVVLRLRQRYPSGIRLR